MSRNSALIFIKPHALTEKTKELVKDALKWHGLEVRQEGRIEAAAIDKDLLVDKHYYSIASKATLLKPDALQVPAEKFQSKFELSWSDVLQGGLAFNAKDACEKLGINAAQLQCLWDQATKNNLVVKFGGGFYCGKLEPQGQSAIFVFNGFFMSLRDKFVAKDAAIYYYVVEWYASNVEWSEFRSNVLGPTDPNNARADSLRGMLSTKWKLVGLKAQPNIGDNCVHGSASPFEGLVEKMNWLGVSLEEDPFGKRLLQAGIPKSTLEEWMKDPKVQVELNGTPTSLFDALEDLDVESCLQKCLQIADPQRAPPQIADPQHVSVNGHKRVLNSALIFIKPHALTSQTQALLEETLTSKGLIVCQQGRIEAATIDKNMLIDRHYYSIASKATILSPEKMNVPANKFEEKFGIKFEQALQAGQVLNAKQACEKLGVGATDLKALWDEATKQALVVKFGGGFYCGKLPVREDGPLFVFNGFFMSMREMYVEDGAAIHYYVVEWEPSKLAWADFRSKVIGCTDPSKAPSESLRGMLYAKWQEMGLQNLPDVTKNGVHASASPFEALAEKMNWLGCALEEDSFGAELLKAGLDKNQIMPWTTDPQVSYRKRAGASVIQTSVFDALEDLDVDGCVAVCKQIAVYKPGKRISKAAVKPNGEVDKVKACRQGWLQKRGPKFGYGWQKRWCVLDENGLLVYYPNETCQEKKGDILIRPSTLVMAFNSKGAPGDAIKHRNGNPNGFVIDEDPQRGRDRHLFYFDAESTKDRDAWIGRIRAFAKAARFVERSAMLKDTWNSLRAGTLKEYYVIFVLGWPGPERGDQCVRIAKGFGYKLLNLNNIFRKECNLPGSRHRKVIQKCLDEDKLVPSTVAVEVLKAAMEQARQSGTKYLMEGFPRITSDLTCWNEMMGDNFKIRLCLFLDSTRDLADYKIHAPRDSVVERCLHDFESKTLHVVNHCRSLKILSTVNSSQDAESVWKEIQRLLAPTVIFVLGGAGAGKTTQCARLANTYNYQHLSAVDLLREEQTHAGYGQVIENCIKEGKEVPVDITVKQLRKTMKDRGWENGKFLVDGFPLSLEDLKGWETAIGDVVNVKFCVYFDCSEASREARLLERGKTSGRAEDNVDAIKNRFQRHSEASMLAVEELSRRGLIRKVQAEGDVEDVWRQVQRIMGPTVILVLGEPGACKGKVCGKIECAFGYTRLSIEQLLLNSSEFGSQTESREVTQPRPTDIVKLLYKAMRTRGWEGGKYIIPDTLPWMSGMFEGDTSLTDLLGPTVSVKYALNLACSQGVLEARMGEQARKEMVLSNASALPVIEKFKNQGMLRTIDADQDFEEMWRDCQSLFGPSVIFVLGGPGAGKGTQCSRISDFFGYHHLSAGDLLRAERKREGSEFGELIEACIKEGKLVPAEITVNLLKREMESHGWEGGKYLIDGFPRSFDNLQAWENGMKGQIAVKFALFFHCSEECMEARLLERGKTSGRSDDNIESIKKRFRTFQTESMPVAERLHQQGLLRRIDAEQDVEDVWKDVQALFGPSVIFVLGGPGAGKGTQCTRISEKFGFTHLSAGDLLREERKRPDSEYGELIESYIREGKLVPVEITLSLLQMAMERHGWQGGKYLVDGFPRSVANFEGWKKQLGHNTSVKFALFFECSEECMEERLLRRGQTSGRSDDNLESIRKRFKTFQRDSIPVLDDLEAQKLVRRVNSEQDPEEVWSCVQELLKNELGTSISNQAVVLIEPGAYTIETARFVQSFLTMKQISILRRGVLTPEELRQKDIIKRHYVHLMRNAEMNPKDLKIKESKQSGFKEAYGVSWEEAVASNSVLNMADGFKQLGFEGKDEALDSALTAAKPFHLAHCLHVVQLKSHDGATSAFVLNGLAHRWLKEGDKVNDLGKSWLWCVVEFNGDRLSWERFNDEIIGVDSTTPLSLRSQVREAWQQLGMKSSPDLLHCGVQASTGPLEGLHHRLIWTGVKEEDDNVGRLLRSSGGVPMDCIQEWISSNPHVEEWIGVNHQKLSGPILDCSAGSDTVILRDAVMAHVRKHIERTEFWTMNALNRSQHASEASYRRFSQLHLESKMPEAIAEKTLFNDMSFAPCKTLTIIHFNDVYNVEARKQEPVGGVARFVTKVREICNKKNEPRPLVLFSGDAFNPSLTSTATQGRHMIPALNAIGINAACYGNHDFDFGVDQLADMAKENNFPWLISNVTLKATGRPLADGHITRMIDYYDKRIGLIGIVEREWLATLSAVDPSEVEYEDFCMCARRLAKQLKEKDGAHLVIAMTHMRVPNDELLAHSVQEVDVILAGHDHHYDVKPVGPFGTYVLKSGTDFQDLTLLKIEFNDKEAEKTFSVVESQHIQIESSIPEDPEMKELVDGCMEKLGAEMDKVIGESAVDLECRFSFLRTQETNMGNFVCDVMKKALNADIAMLNSGTLRTGAIVPKGPFRMRDLVDLLPMLDQLCLLQITGAQVLSALENSVSQYPRHEGRFAQVSGISFTFDAARESGKRVVEGSVHVGGKPIDLQQNYKLVVKDYLRRGKDGYDVFAETVCLADGEQAGILPTIVREYFLQLSQMNGLSENAPPVSTRRASTIARRSSLLRVGSGPEAMKQYAIAPMVEGRITCLNPSAVLPV